MKTFLIGFALYSTLIFVVVSLIILALIFVTWTIPIGTPPLFGLLRLSLLFGFVINIPMYYSDATQDIIDSFMKGLRSGLDKT